ncbi:MAG: MerR family transcriptional regulator [Bacteriovoracaceae bacterium]|nr:MerR family transcriptional regulator [Bacteriovoracaceae bacterium]
MSLFNIHIASQLSGVAAATIRAWEKRYKVLAPDRAENGHRLYTEADIEKLTLLQSLTQCGHSIGKIAQKSIEELKELISKDKEFDPVEQFLERKTKDFDSEKIRSGILLAFSLYKLDIISYELDKAKRFLGPRDFALEIILPLFRDIGLRVSQGKLTIAQEHTLSAIVQFHMGQVIALHYTRSHFKPGLIILAAPEGELHEIGLLTACLLCVQHKIQFLYLGKDLPAESLSQTINQMNPTTVILGVTKGHEISDTQTLQEYLKSFKSKIDSKIKIIVGGNIKPYVKNEIEEIGVELLLSLESLDQFLKIYSH